MPPPSAPRTFSLGTRTSSRTRLTVDEPRIPSLFSSAPVDRPGESRSTMKAVLPCALEIGEDDEQVRPAAVGDVLLLAAQDERLAVVGEPRLGGQAGDVRAGARLGQGVGAQVLHRRQLGQIALLLPLVAKEDHRQGADADVAGEGDHPGGRAAQWSALRPPGRRWSCRAPYRRSAPGCRRRSAPARRPRASAPGSARRCGRRALRIAARSARGRTPAPCARSRAAPRRSARG